MSEAHIALLRAPNPSAMTLSGTNSYLVDCGNGCALAIDPGPAIERHVAALLDAAAQRGLRIVAIAFTHGHPDHAPAAVPLARATGAPVYAHPDSRAPHDRELELEGTLRVGDRTLRVMDAPGHTFDHVVFYEPQARTLFTGDTILGEGTVVIAPPGGAMRPYQRTLERLALEFPQVRTIRGGHGPLVEDAPAKIAEYIAHRKERESQLIAALANGPQTIPELLARIYGDTRAALWPAAARQLLAYLDALCEEGRVVATPEDHTLTPEESALLNPSWASLVDPESAKVLEAELGASYRIERIDVYMLV
ncbi:MAG TPA: MBL fold metallo-hydrolase [Candidatus Tyrphobacter sp.]